MELQICHWGQIIILLDKKTNQKCASMEILLITLNYRPWNQLYS